MSHRNMIVAALALTAALAVGPAATAQEAIMLERIGAVRMAMPEELQRGQQGRFVATDLQQTSRQGQSAEHGGAAN